MFNMTKESFTIKAIIFLLAIILISTTAFSQINRDVELTIETDQPQYYREEEITYHVQLLENGTGAEGSPVCVEETGPDGNWTFGICGIPDINGNFSFTSVIAVDALLGVYNVEVHSIEFDIYEYTTFEVVSTTIEVDANGPYEGTNDPISFTGNVSGGKYPYTWFWEFGDGETSDEQNPQHAYSSPGEYIATLTVTDKGGYFGNDTAVVTINPGENQPPSNPTIDGPTSGKSGVSYDYTFMSVDPDGDDVYYMVSWGCCGPGEDFHEYGPFESGVETTISKTYNEEGTFTISAYAMDINDAESGITTLEVTMPDVHIFDRIEQPFLQFVFDLLHFIFERFISI